MAVARSEDPNEPGPPEGDPVRVLIVDDQASFRRALSELVAATQGFVLAGEAASGEEALDAVDELEPRLVIMDKRMPGMGGVEATRTLTLRHPEVVVVLVSVEEPEPRVTECCGAFAFLSKRDLSIRTLRDTWRSSRQRSGAELKRNQGGG
jgi:two-component system invasion response regulator UvrY